MLTFLRACFGLFFGFVLIFIFLVTAAPALRAKNEPVRVSKCVYPKTDDIGLLLEARMKCPD